MSETIEAQLGCISQANAFLNKYFSLRKRCEQLQQANEKLVNRVQHVKKLIKRYKRDRRYLISRLDEYGDGFREAQVPVMWEEDELFNCLRPPPPYPCGASSDDGEGSSWLGLGDRHSALSAIQPLLVAHGLGDSTLANVAASVVSSANKNKKVKTEKDKDPSAPKKPANAFLMFCQQRRPAIQEEYLREHKQEIAHHEMTRRLAQQWNNLSQDDKKEKERYEKELKEYSARDIIPPPSDSIPVPAREGVIPSHSLQIKKERD
ncbi:uncharacterized protein LOC112563879 isoform X2 [Pomacea canaliculata]|uniref:uncharacterized protein LOC112563879 isoform X2 n=1 Tax=Pomacea canaliculata TaxID=400727 RepID=UPI000D73F9CB|nr:uncharacterized protein LOC112563879 isoform X2 [Pomacea canaliculata]